MARRLSRPELTCLSMHQTLFYSEIGNTGGYNIGKSTLALH